MKTGNHMEQARRNCMTQSRSYRSRIFKLHAFAMLLVLPLATAAAQTTPKPSKPDNSVYAELAKAPRKAAARRNPLATDPDAVAAGGKLFSQHCAECHGEMAEGGKKGPSLLVDDVQAGHSRNPLLAVDQRRRPPWHARLVQTPRTSALAVSYLHQVTRFPVSNRPQRRKSPATLTGAAPATFPPPQASNRSGTIIGSIPLRDALM